MESTAINHENPSSSCAQLLVSAKSDIVSQVSKLKYYRRQCRADSLELKKMCLGHKVCKAIGDQRLFSQDDLDTLIKTLNSFTSLTWSVRYGRQGAMIVSKFNVAIPEIKFTFGYDGFLVVKGFSYNIETPQGLLLN